MTRLAGGTVAVLMAVCMAPVARAQEVNPADGTGLVVDYPVFQPVTPPSGYVAALQKGTRTPDGRPGPEYWQQFVDYDIDVKIEPETALLTASERITVRNETPAERRALVLHLYQNVFGEGAARGRSSTVTGGMTLRRVAVSGPIVDPHGVTYGDCVAVAFERQGEQTTDAQ